MYLQSVRRSPVSPSYCSDAILFPYASMFKIFHKIIDIHFIETLSKILSFNIRVFISLSLKASDDKRKIIRKSQILLRIELRKGQRIKCRRVFSKRNSECVPLMERSLFG